MEESSTQDNVDVRKGMGMNKHQQPLQQQQTNKSRHNSYAESRKNWYGCVHAVNPKGGKKLTVPRTTRHLGPAGLESFIPARPATVYWYVVYATRKHWLSSLASMKNLPVRSRDFFKLKTEKSMQISFLRSSDDDRCRQGLFRNLPSLFNPFLLLDEKILLPKFCLR